MMRKKRLLVSACMVFLFLAATLPVLAGGGPEPPPYTYQEVGPAITGDLTLAPAADNLSFNATLKGTCGKEKVTVTASLKTVRPADTLTAQEIQTSAANYFLKAGSFQMKAKACKAASGPGDLMVKSLTGLQQKKKGKKVLWTGKGTLTFIAPKPKATPQPTPQPKQ
jgi:hypothetical protein